MADEIIKIHCPELDKFFDWHKIYNISPFKIKYALTYGFDVLKDEWGKVWTGTWDKYIPIENDFVHISVTKMIKDGTPFEETSLFKYTAKKIESGQKRWSCLTIEEFKKREEHILETFNNIKENGFKTQEELNSSGKYSLQVNGHFVDDPGLVIDRAGRYLYHNANHRLPMCKFLNIPTIPIKINVRHKEWAEFILYVKTLSKSIWGENRIYQPVNHIDFQDYNCEWSNYRSEIIKNFLSKDCKTLLDIGALWGHFASEFEDCGLKCTAVESNREFANIMDKLRISQDKKFKIVTDDIFNLKDRNFDIVLALNIFHHFLKKEETYKKLIEFLKSLDMKEMYFQVHRPEEKQMIGAYRNYNKEDFVSFILENSCLKYSMEIGEENGRKLYKLWR